MIRTQTSGQRFLPSTQVQSGRGGFEGDHVYTVCDAFAFMRDQV